jgi:copper homeostasis protein
MQFEVCVDSAENCALAEQGGADRVELCCALIEGGVTPSVGTVRVARKMAPRIGIMAMVRPRGGDFCYSEAEFAAMEEDTRALVEAGADGIVLGLLRPDGSVDETRTSRLVELAAPRPVTFHRAFDMSADPFEALEAIVRTGCTRILTSGQEASAIEGAELLAELVRRAGDRVTIMVGGSVRERNISRLIRLTGAGEYHFTAFDAGESRMTFRNTRIFMGGALRPPEFTLSATSPAKVAACIARATAV